jgi:hypothetical protein
MYGATSGDWKRSYDKWTEAPASPATATPHRQRPPRQSSTLPESLRRRTLLPCAQVRKSPGTFLMPKADVIVHWRCAPILTQLAQLRFRLVKPVGHAHFTVHRHRGGEVIMGLLAIAPAAMQFAVAQVAMGDKRSHAAGLS